MSQDLTTFSVPLFPLGTVLYPGGLLPLRIFEVRYLDMISKCHRSGSPFGVVTLTKGAEVRKIDPDRAGGDGFADESFHPIGTLATITELSKPQPGLLMIRCTGTQRFRMASYDRLQHGQWFASATMAGVPEVGSVGLHSRWSEPGPRKPAPRMPMAAYW